MELNGEQPLPMILQKETKLLSTTPFNKICRTCLSLEKQIFNIFKVICKDIHLSEVFANYIAVQVAEDDHLPQHVCTSCIAKFEEMYGFIQQCEYVDVMLRAEINNRNKNTTEINKKMMNIVNSVENGQNYPPPEVEKLLTFEDDKQKVIPFLEVDAESDRAQTDIKTVKEEPLEDAEFFCMDPDTTTYSQQDILHTLHSIKKSDSDTEIYEDLEDTKILPENVYESQSIKGYHVMEPCLFQYSCKRCKQYFDSPIKLRDHTKQYHSHVCINCNKKIANLHNFQLHMAKCKKKFHRYSNENQGNKPLELLEKLIKARNFPFTIYSCRKCNTFFDSQDGLKIHRKQVKHRRTNNYKCPICLKIVSSKYSLKEHMETHTAEELSSFDLNLDIYSIPNNDYKSTHSQPDCSLSSTTDRQQNNCFPKLLRELLQSDKSSNTFHECRNCKLVFSSYDELTLHQKLMNHSNRKRYFNPICPICNKNFDRPGSLKQHMITHTKEKAFACEICQMRFTLKFSLRRHMMRHTNERPYPCKLCDKGYIQAACLVEHIRVKHTGETPFECNYCGKRFARRKSYHAHLQIHRTKTELRSVSSIKSKTKYKQPSSSEVFKCNVCERKFNRKTSLNQHMLYLHKEKAFLCSQCGKSFGLRNSLLIHMRVHTGVKPHLCTICKKTFSQLESLKCHLRTHTGEKPFVCKICSKSFRQSAHLMYHMRMHTLEKSYKCSYCEKSFRTRANLNAHKRIHTGETPFACEVCNKRFYHSSNLKKHKKVHEKRQKVIDSTDTSSDAPNENVMN